MYILPTTVSLFMETTKKIQCFLCKSDTTSFSKSKNKFDWYNYQNDKKICAICYYKEYRRQLKAGTFQSNKEKIGLRRCSECGTDKTQVTMTKTGYPHRKWVTDRKGGYLCHNCCKKTIYRAREREYKIKTMLAADPRKLWAQMSIGNHKNNGFTLQLTKHELEEMALKTDKCAICDVTLAWGYLTGKAYKISPSLDRINNDKVVTKDNVQILCVRCNRTKSDRTMNEFIEYCNLVAKRFPIKEVLN